MKKFWITLILVVVAIVFRDKLRPFYLRIKSKFGKGKSKKGPPGFPPSATPLRKPMPRKIMPPSRRPIRRPAPRRKGEIDDVLKKLKDMGK